jgi:hypothetical protein
MKGCLNGGLLVQSSFAFYSSKSLCSFRPIYSTKAQSIEVPSTYGAGIEDILALIAGMNQTNSDQISTTLLCVQVSLCTNWLADMVFE